MERAEALRDGIALLDPLPAGEAYEGLREAVERCQASGRRPAGLGREIAAFCASDEAAPTAAYDARAKTRRLGRLARCLETRRDELAQMLRGEIWA